MTATPLWRPSLEQIARAQLTSFTSDAEALAGRSLPSFAALHAWSVAEPEAFWGLVWSFCGVIAAERGERVLVDGDRLPGARWFPDAKLNFAENLLRRRDDGIALIFRREETDDTRREGKIASRRALTFAELYEQVERTAAALRAAGVFP